VLVAAAVDGDLPVVLVHRRVDRLEVVERGRVALRAVGAEPGGVARADRAAGEVVLGVLGVGAGLDHRVHRGRRLGRGAAGEGDFTAAATTAATPVAILLLRIAVAATATVAAAIAAAGRLAAPPHAQRRAAQHQRQAAGVAEQGAAGQGGML